MSSYVINSNNDFIKFDTIKIRTSINYLSHKNIKFNKNYNNGLLIGEYYNSKNENHIPYDLYIGISHKKQSLTLEFSSKILLDDYPQLITENSFKQCLDHINQLGICTLDKDQIINDCYFSKVHLTKDIKYDLTDNVLNSLNLCTNDYRRYKWQRYRNEGIRFTKDVKSKDCRESIVIYDKEKEIIKNKDFLSILSLPDQVINYFDGIVRFEMELDTPNKICKAFNIESTYINNVFSSKENPLLTQFNKIFGEGNINTKQYITNYDAYSMDAIIEKHHGDIKRIEQELKDLNVYSSNSRNGLSERMKKIKYLAQQRNEQMYDSSGILSEIRGKLGEKNQLFQFNFVTYR